MSTGELLERINATKSTLEEVYRATRFDQLVLLPEFSMDGEVRGKCEALFREWVLPEGGGIIPDQEFSVPKWVFLEYLVKERARLLHGSAKRIGRFEPRVSHDNIVDGHLARVYAASNGILATFFAILDRDSLAKHGVCAMNVFYAPFEDADGREKEGFHFAIDYRCVPRRPFKTGFVHVLGRDGFVSDYRGTQWHSETPAVPHAVIEMGPGDFPLLDSVRGIDWEALERKRIHTPLEGFPWMEDEALYPIGKSQLG